MTSLRFINRLRHKKASKKNKFPFIVFILFLKTIFIILYFLLPFIFLLIVSNPLAVTFTYSENKSWERKRGRRSVVLVLEKKTTNIKRNTSSSNQVSTPFTLLLHLLLRFNCFNRHLCYATAFELEVLKVRLIKFAFILILVNLKWRSRFY